MRHRSLKDEHGLLSILRVSLEVGFRGGESRFELGDLVIIGD